VISIFEEGFLVAFDGLGMIIDFFVDYSHPMIGLDKIFFKISRFLESSECLIIQIKAIKRVGEDQKSEFVVSLPCKSFLCKLNS